MERTLAAIPPLEKRAYRDQPEAFIARDIPPHRLYRGKTSGTTGTALPLWYTLEALAEEYATVWRMRRTSGVRKPSDPNLTFNGQIIVPFSQMRPPFWRTNAYIRQTLFSIYHMTPANLPEYVDAIHARPARYAQGYPSSIHLVARAMLEQGRPLPLGRLAAVFTSSESLLAFQRETIEMAFGAPVRDRYGVGEFGVSMTECALGRHHVDMEFCVVEVEAAEETEDYVTGPLLITGLAHDATPLFRYRIGDVGTRAKRPCPCGRPGDVFLEVDGRIEDYVLTPDGRLIGRLDHVFKEQLDVAEAQILQDTKDAVDVLVIPRSTYTEISGRRLLKEIRSRLGHEIEIRVHLVDSIPREPNGKFRAVKSRVGSITR
jgi:phenylacetate-CoA ligase